MIDSYEPEFNKVNNKYLKERVYSELFYNIKAMIVILKVLVEKEMALNKGDNKNLPKGMQR